MQQSKWNSDKTVKFIKLYKSYDLLWNPQHKYYKDRTMRNISCHKISKAMNINGFKAREVKLKVKSLRQTYAQKVKSIKDSSDFERICNTMKWFKYMDDIIKWEKAHRFKNNLNVDMNVPKPEGENMINEDGDNIEFGEEKLNENKANTDSDYEFSEDEDFNLSNEKNKKINIEVSPITSVTIKREHDVSLINSYIPSCDVSLTESFIDENSDTVLSNQDEYVAFANYVANKLRIINEKNTKQRYICEKMIVDALCIGLINTSK